MLPWGSLAAGVASALLMNRSPERAWLVAIAVGAGWIVLIAAMVVSRFKRNRSGSDSRLMHAVWFSTFATKQSLMQITLFFVLPLYWHASAGTGAHHVFVVLVAVVAALVSWDPMLERVLERPAAAIVIEGLSSFVGLAAVLPILGLSNRVSLLVAAGGTAVTVPLVAWLTSAREHRRATAVLAAVTGVILAAGVNTGLQRAIPAAPLRLMKINIGTKLAMKTVFTHRDQFPRRPPQMVCATSIWAPRGLHDALLHVWRHESEVTDRIPLDVRGGRAKGFRTWSNKQNFGSDPAGTWTCSVETESGQLLGQRHTSILR